MGEHARTHASSHSCHSLTWSQPESKAHSILSKCYYSILTAHALTALHKENGSVCTRTQQLTRLLTTILLSLTLISILLHLAIYLCDQQHVIVKRCVHCLNNSHCADAHKRRGDARARAHTCLTTPVFLPRGRGRWELSYIMTVKEVILNACATHVSDRLQIHTPSLSTRFEKGHRNKTKHYNNRKVWISVARRRSRRRLSRCYHMSSVSTVSGRQ